jgi:uncharacterized membrane protein YdjX (TVP38/TMEM64 family)
MDHQPISLKLKLALGFAAFVCITAGLYIQFEYGLIQRIISLIDENTPPELFIILFIFLPLAGVPISFFVLLLGIKFGLGYGLLLLEIILPVHMLFAYFLAHTVRKPIVNYLVNRKHYQIPQAPEDKALMYSFLFLTFPAFPYSVKLYMLPLAGFQFRYCFWLNWAIQGTLCIPFVLLGESAADLNLPLFGVTVFAFIGLYFFLNWVKKRYTLLQKEKMT